MSAELRRVTKPEVWTDWESQVINGVFPLRRFLGGSDHSAVFLSEYKAANLPDVAIKFVATDSLHAEAAQLVQWGTAVTLSHPHLIRLYDVGRCQFKGRGFLFVVMEHAEQNLAQILPRRPLTSIEARELLLPTLDALAFLHRNQLVHGQLKPANFLVVNDQLKLATDTVRPIGTSASGSSSTSLYDPPELQDSGFSTAGDVWGLGITLFEALTQRAPTWPDERAETVALPAGFPLPFVHTVRRCLSRAPANRPTIADLENQYKPAPQAHVSAVPQPPPREATRESTPAQSSPKPRSPLPGIAALLLIALGAWVGFRVFQQHSNSEPPTSDGSQGELQAAAPADPEPSDTADATAAAGSPEPGTGASGIPASGAPVADAPVATPVASTTVERDSGASAPATSSRAPGSPPAGSPAAGAPVASTPATSAPAPGTSAPIASAPVASAPIASAPVASAPIASAAVTSGPGASGPGASGPALSGPAVSGRPSAPATPASRTAMAKSAESTSGVSSPATRQLTQQASLPTTSSPSVLHRVSPDIPRAIQEKIRGHVKVTVRVLVGPSGDVVGEFLESPGPSRYFARLAGDAAGAWKFAPADTHGPRVWLLRFEFERTGVTIDSAPAQ